MKDFIHKPVSLDGFFKERLEQMPVDAGSCDLQWQLIKQQVRQAPPRLPGASELTIFLVIAAISMLLLWGIPYKMSNDPDAPKEMPTPIPSHEKREAVPVIENKKQAIKYNSKLIVDSTTNEIIITTAPVATDSVKSVVIINRPDSSKKIALPENKKDSLFIFW